MALLRRDWIAGTMLLVTGFLLLGTRLFPDLVPVVPLLLGLALLAFFFVTRAPGALVVGSVIVGIGIGVLVVRGTEPNVGGAGFLVSLAAGFLLAWLLALIFNVRSLRAWPLVPGIVLLVLGGAVYTGNFGRDLLAFAFDWWPVLLVVTGAYLLLQARLRARREVDEETVAVPAIPRSEVGARTDDEEREDEAWAERERRAARERERAARERDEEAERPFDIPREPPPIEDPDQPPAIGQPDLAPAIEQEDQPPAIEPLRPPPHPLPPGRQGPPIYPAPPSSHSIADANGGQVGGDRPGSVESV
jgi:hypothetical protein